MYFLFSRNRLSLVCLVEISALRLHIKITRFSVSHCKLWKTGEDGLCCSCSAIQTQPGPSSLLEERSKNPIVFVSFVLSATPETGGNGQDI